MEFTTCTSTSSNNEMLSILEFQLVLERKSNWSPCWSTRLGRFLTLIFPHFLLPIGKSLPVIPYQCQNPPPCKHLNHTRNVLSSAHPHHLPRTKKWKSKGLHRQILQKNYCRRRTQSISNQVVQIQPQAPDTVLMSVKSIQSRIQNHSLQSPCFHRSAPWLLSPPYPPPCCPTVPPICLVLHWLKSPFFKVTPSVTIPSSHPIEWISTATS